jgi:hypothetical protein
MKLGEKLVIEDGKMHHVEAWDPNEGLRTAEMMRDVKDTCGGRLLNFTSKEFGEPQYVYPPWLEQLWSQNWGVRLDDPAFEDVVQMELASGKYESFRV